MESSFPEIGDRPEELDAVASHVLDAEQFARAASYGTPQQVAAGEFVFQAGDDDADLILVETARLEVLLTATEDSPEEVFLRSGPGQFVGELNLLTGQTRLLSGRVAEAGVVHRVGPASFRRLMARTPSCPTSCCAPSWPGGGC